MITWFRKLFRRKTEQERMDEFTRDHYVEPAFWGTDSLEKKLDELLKTPGIQRKMSSEQTPEGPVWSSWGQCWIESHEQLRERLKALRADK